MSNSSQSQKYLQKRSFPPGRSSTLRKAFRYQNIRVGNRKLDAGPPHVGHRKGSPLSPKSHKAAAITEALRSGQIPFNTALIKQQIQEVGAL